MCHHPGFRAVIVANAVAALVNFSAANATIISAGDVSPPFIPGLQDADITGQGVNVEEGSLTVDGGSNLTADSLFGAGNPATTNSQIFISDPGTIVNLVGSQNRFDIGNQGVSSLTVSNGAVIDGASVPCEPNSCNAFFGNFSGATSNLIVTGAGSRIDTLNSLIFGSGAATTTAVDGFTAGIPGGTSTTTAQILDGGVVNAKGPEGSVVIAVGPQGGGVTGSEQVNATVTVDGSGSALNVNNSGLTVGNGTNATGVLNIQNQGLLNIQNSAAGDATNSSFEIGRDDGAVGNVRVSNATVTMSGAGQKSLVSVGRQGDSDGTLLIENGGKFLNTDNGGGLLIGSEDAISRGVVTVTGTGSVLQTAASNVDTVLGKNSFFFVGDNGNGTLNILDGGRVDGGIFGDVGRGAGGVGHLNVDGKDAGGVASTLRLSGGISGFFGTSALIHQGAFLTAALNGIGTIDVTNGGSIIIDGQTMGDFAGFRAGVNAGGFGTINVIGEGSSIEVQGDPGTPTLAIIGREDGSVGALNVLNGGAVSLNSDGKFLIGLNPGAVGTVLVSGSDGAGNGSVLDGGRFIGVGVQFDEVTSGGTGTLTVANGGRVVADTVLVGGNGFLSGAGGTIDGNVAAFDGGIVAPGSSPGDLTILGDLDLTGGGVLQIELGSISDFDRLFIGGGLVIDDTTSIAFSFIDGAADDPDLLQNFDLSSFFFDIDPLTFDENDPTASAQAFDMALFTDASFTAQGNGFIGDIDVNGQGGLQVVNITSTNAVPEPGTLALLGVGLIGLGYARRRRKAA